MHIPDCSLPELIFDRILPQGIAIRDPQRDVQYSELASEVRHIAAALKAHGIKPGDVVALHLPNSADYAAAFHGVLSCGAVVTPIATYATEADIAAQCQLTKTQLIISPSDMPELREFPEVWAGEYPDGQQLACLPMSSGTTGLPKAVKLTHRNLVANTLQFSQVVPLRGDETCLAVLPLTHIYGLTALMNTPLFLGSQIVVDSFQADRFIETHETHKINVTFIAPPLARLLATHPKVESTDFSSLRTIVSGAAALNPHIGKVVEQRVGAKIYQGYGMSEASPVTHIAQSTKTPLDSIGSPLPETEARIVDTKTLQDTEAEGELWVRGPQIMQGYLHNYQATAATITADGWLRTGDLAIRNDNEFYIVDRIKDLILSHGFQVSPAKLEKILMNCPGVEDCAVVRGYAPNGEEWPTAVIVGTATQYEVMNYMNERVSRYERIREVRYVSEIPRSAAGKTLRKDLVLDRRPN